MQPNVTENQKDTMSDRRQDFHIVIHFQPDDLKDWSGYEQQVFFMLVGRLLLAGRVKSGDGAPQPLPIPAPTGAPGAARV